MRGPKNALAWWLPMLLAVVACAEAEAPPSPDPYAGYYAQRPGKGDGIGKMYMGREISDVMGHRGAGWLERPQRERDERTDLLVENLPLGAGSVVADVGAGTGYFTLPIARRVPAGKVFAVDIQEEMIDILSERAEDEGLSNVVPVLGSKRHPGLAGATLDLILIVDAYHEFSHPREMGERLAAALKPGGRMILIEYRAEDPKVSIKRLHKMTEAQAKQEMAAIGLQWVETGTFLPLQHFLVFQKPSV